MNITTDQKPLLALLTKAQAVASVKSPMPHASRLLLEAQHGRLSVVASNEILGISGSVAADVTAPGRICVDARGLVDRVKALEGVATITVKDFSAKLSCKGNKLKYTMHTTEPDHFPPAWEAPKDADWITVSGSLLADAIAGTRFAVSPEKTRGNIHQMLLQCDSEKLRTVGTDGHRLSLVDAVMPAPRVMSTTVPGGAIADVARLAESGDVEFTADERTSFFRQGTVVLAVRVNAEPFPPWRQIIPPPVEQVVTVNREALLRALRAVAISGQSVEGDSAFSGVRVRIDGDAIHLSAESHKDGDSQDEVACRYGGQAKAFAMNARYFAEWLGSVDVDEVTMGVGGDLDPVRLEGGNATGILMPVRT